MFACVCICGKIETPGEILSNTDLLHLDSPSVNLSSFSTPNNSNHTRTRTRPVRSREIGAQTSCCQPGAQRGIAAPGYSKYICPFWEQFGNRMIRGRVPMHCAQSAPAFRILVSLTERQDKGRRWNRRRMRTTLQGQRRRIARTAAGRTPAPPPPPLRPPPLPTTRTTTCPEPSRRRRPPRCRRSGPWTHLLQVSQSVGARFLEERVRWNPKTQMGVCFGHILNGRHTGASRGGVRFPVEFGRVSHNHPRKIRVRTGRNSWQQ